MHYVDLLIQLRIGMLKCYTDFISFMMKLNVSSVPEHIKETAEFLSTCGLKF